MFSLRLVEAYPLLSELTPRRDMLCVFSLKIILERFIVCVPRSVYVRHLTRFPWVFFHADIRCDFMCFLFYYCQVQRRSPVCNDPHTARRFFTPVLGSFSLQWFFSLH